MTETMKIKAIAPWFGGKRNMAGEIIKLLGPHRVYWEPFCGSMAVLLSKAPCVMETVCDLHSDLVNLARVLQDDELSLKLYGRLNRTLMVETLFCEAAERYHKRGYHASVNLPDMDRAYDYFICAWLGRNGAQGLRSYNQGYCVRYTSNGGHSAKRWRSVIESIPDWNKRLMNVAILCRDGFEVIERIEDKEGTVIYADPPYLVKAAKYIYDFTDADHTRLAGLLNRFKKTRVVVSYYDHPKLDELYPGWAMHRFDVSKAMAHSNKPGTNKTRAVEVLLVNEKENQQKLF